MTVKLVDPEGLFQPGIYRQVAVATGARHIHIAGQVSMDEQGSVVAQGDLGGQVFQAYRNIQTALTGVGASFADVVRLTVFVVDWEPGKMDALVAGMRRAATELDAQPAPATLIGVASLFDPRYLVEIEATAVTA